VDYRVRSNRPNQLQDTIPVSDVDFVMFKASDLLLQTRLVPACIPLGAKENGALIVINSVYLPAF